MITIGYGLFSSQRTAKLKKLSLNSLKFNNEYWHCT